MDSAGALGPTLGALVDYEGLSNAVNNTKIKWTPALIEAQKKRNAEIERKAKAQLKADHAKQRIGPINLAAKSERSRNRFSYGKSPKRPGYIYIIKVGDVCKIGLTEHFPSRIKILKQQYRFRTYRLLALIEVPNMLAIEAELHRKFTDQRVTGEWFRLNQDDIDTIMHIAQVL